MTRISFPLATAKVLLTAAATVLLAACTNAIGNSNAQRQPQVVSCSNPAPLMAEPIKGEIILKRKGYTCSYNPEKRQPNYVSWSLTPDKLKGTVKREPFFYEDTDLSDDARALLSDYYNSGFDRGHMCPAADNKWDAEAMKHSFYLSNICPQKHTLNEGDWEKLESACRNWVRQKGITLYIACGPIFDNSNPRKLRGRIPVPDKFFKAIVCLDEGKEKSIGFIYSNDTSQRPMAEYACSIDDIEQLTGYNLFCKLDKKTQKKLEAQSNLNDWQRNKPRE